MKSKKHLMIFTGSYPFGKGENFIEGELKSCTENFEKITLIPLYYGASTSPRQVPENVTFISPILAGGSFILLLKSVFNLAPLFPFIKELFRGNILNGERLIRWFRISSGTRILLQSDTIKRLINADNSQLYFYWGTGASYLLPFIKNRTCILRVHGSDLYEETNPLFFRNEMYTNAKKIITISEFGAIYLRDRYPQFSNKIVVYRLGTNDFGKGKASEDSVFRIVSCSSVISLKRVESIVKALEQINDKKIQWTHFGTGPLLNTLQKEISKLPGNISTSLPGYKSIDEIMQFYATEPADLFINVSISEGLPVSIMEAYSFGIPAIATNVGGTAEIVDSNNGILLDKEFSIIQLTNAIQEMANKDLSAYRTNARMKWENNFNASVNFNNFANFLNEISNA